MDPMQGASMPENLAGLPLTEQRQYNPEKRNVLNNSAGAMMPGAVDGSVGTGFDMPVGGEFGDGNSNCIPIGAHQAPRVDNPDLQR